MTIDFSKLDIEPYAVSAGSALAILVVGWIIAGAAAGAVRRLSERSARVSPTLVPLFSRLTAVVLRLAVLLAALEKLGVDTSGFFAVIGAAGLAIGLALKDTVSDVAAGVILLILRPVDVGETASIGGTIGTIDSIDIFQTTLTTPDGIPVVLNNSSVRGAKIENFSRAQLRRADLEIGIGYGDDIGKAQRAIETVLDGDSRVLKDPSYLVNTQTLGDSAVILLVRYTTAAPDFFGTKLDITRAIKEKLDAEGISFPFPQQDVHLIQGDVA